MKRGLKVFVGLACLFVIGLPAFSQPSSKSIVTVTLDNFDSTGAQEYLYNGEKLSWNWSTSASRFVAEGFPKMNSFDGIPNSLEVFKRGQEGTPKVLGVKTSFKRKGDNWFEIYPVKDDKNYEIPFIGTVSQIDFWVWGSNYNYYLELLVRDAKGIVHVLNAGSLYFSGWKNVVVKIPGWLSQHSQYRTGPAEMSFVGFRVRSDAEEYVDDYVIFLDEIKYTTNPLSNIYDGYELKDADFGNEGEE